LLSCYVAYMKAALALIRKHQIERGEHPNALGLVIRLFEPLKELPEFQDLYAYILSSPLADRVFVDAGGNPIREPGSQSHWLMNFSMMPVLTEYIGRELMVDFDEGRAKAVYADLEASLECTQAIYSVVAPLQHFEGPDEDIRLDGTMLLRKLSEEELEHLWHLGEFTGMIDRSQALGWSFGLVARLVTERNAPTNLSEVRGPVWRIVTALRLLKSGQVGVPAVIQRLSEPAFGLPGGTATTSGPAVAALGPSYRLLSEETEPLIAMLQALAEAASAEHLRIPLRRFNYAYERTRPADRLVDLWIALEALFLKREEQMEMSYRAALRIARFVGHDADERVEIVDRMKKSYNARSRVVHGDPPPRDIADTTAFTEEVLRKSLRSSVLSGSVPDLDKLDLDAARADLKE
jgi:hypothetical protein